MIYKTLSQKVMRESMRVVVMVLIGMALIHFSPILALGVGVPAFSPWGLFVGGMMLAAAISHVMRRLLFPRLDLQAIAIRAVGERHEDGNLPAAIVFASICAILGLLLYLNASLLRM
jgi:hypothetical protein